MILHESRMYFRAYVGLDCDLNHHLQFPPGPLNIPKKHICRIVLGLGAWQNFVYVFFGCHSLWGETG